MIMGVKNLPAVRNYWDRSHDALTSGIIPSIMSCKRWERILSCLHLVDNDTVQRCGRNKKVPPPGPSTIPVQAPSQSMAGVDVTPLEEEVLWDADCSDSSEQSSLGSDDFGNGSEVDDTNDPNEISDSDEGHPNGLTIDRDGWPQPPDPHMTLVDKLAKTRWLIEHFVLVAQSLYSMEQMVCVDEMIVPYKGKYCSIRQFLRNKPTRFGIKIWALASCSSRYVFKIDVYLGKGTGGGPHGLGHAVVTGLLEGLENRGHTVVLDNLFSSVRLFHDLLTKGIWATGTIKGNRKGLPKDLTRKKTGTLRGNLVIKMHVHRQIVGISWQDSDMVTLLSTGADAWEPGVTVLRCLRGKVGQLIVPSTPVHRQYEMFMRGVDVTDQLRVNYSVQLSSHKWWHKIFAFIVDQSIINSYILFNSEMEKLGLPVMRHMRFNLAIADDLIKGLLERAANPVSVKPCRHSPAVPCYPDKEKRRRKCVVCGSKQKWFCPGCAFTWLCGYQCYAWYHLPEQAELRKLKPRRRRLRF